MSTSEQTIPATLEPDGQLVLSQKPELPAGPVQVTIRLMTAKQGRGLTDVIREIEADQLSKGYAGRTDEEMKAFEDKRRADDDERDQMLDAARR